MGGGPVPFTPEVQEVVEQVKEHEKTQVPTMDDANRAALAVTDVVSKEEEDLPKVESPLTWI